MKRLTERHFKIGFDDSNKLPSYATVYEKLREYENKEGEKENSVVISKSHNESK